MGKCSDYNDGATTEEVQNRFRTGVKEEFETSIKASQQQVGGKHYKHYKIQPWEFFQANNIPFHKADIIKRILRYDHPTGGGKEDLDKIRHELDLIEEFSEVIVIKSACPPPGHLQTT